MEHDEDDLPPKRTAWDWYWYYANRWAEEAMRWGRLWGLLIIILWAYVLYLNTWEG